MSTLGHSHFDLNSYEKYFTGKLEDYELPDEIIKKALADLPDASATSLLKTI